MSTDITHSINNDIGNPSAVMAAGAVANVITPCPLPHTRVAPQQGETMHTDKYRKIRSTIRWVMWGVALAALTFGRPGISRAQDSQSDVERRLHELEETVKQLQKNQAATDTTSEPSKLSAYYKDGFTLATSDGQYKLILRGYVQADGRFFIDNKTGAQSQFLFRRVRPVLDGTVFKYFDFRVLPDFAGSKLTLFDAYVDVNYIRELRLQIGKYKPPVGIERLQSARNLFFVERGLTKNLVPTRDIGVMLHGDVWDGALSYAAGIFDGAPDFTNIDSDGDSDKDFAGRVFAQPWKTTGVGPLQGLGFGLAGTYGHQHGSTSNTELPSYVSAGETTFFSYNVNSSDPTKTALAEGTHSRISPQGYYFWGPFGLLTDYVTSAQGVSGGGKAATLRHNAWQVAGSYVLTGEAASYDGVVPAQPFDPWKGTWGAVQVAARYGVIDIDDAAFRDGFANPNTSAREAKDWTLGVNWYLNPNIKFVLNYSNTDFRGGASGGDRRTEKAVLTRVQFVF